mgnify:FL=1
MIFQAPRGTYDRMPDQQRLWQRINKVLEEISDSYGYDRIDTPVIEDAKLFSRGVGDVTDIMEKETYTFPDRGGDLLTLRPEGTAPVCRAYIEHGMHNLPQPVRLYYVCPVFRYERPQSGRYRQHHQFGVEVLGSAEPEVDVEVIELAWNILKKLDVSDIKLKINTMGDSDSRRLYISKLQDYLNSKIDQIPESIKPRVSANPLRVLDSKDPKMFEINNSAPKCLDYINAASSEHWMTLLKNLDALSIPYEVDHKLVRGFDYYTRTVFEIVPSVEKTQNTLIGGGRYDGLIEMLGGKSTPGIGFAMGLERVASALDHTLSELESNNSIKLLVAHMGDPAKERAVLLSSRIRTAGLPAVLAPTRGIKSQLRYATSISATHAIIVGEEELQNREVVLRTFATHSQETISEANLINFLSSIS